MATQVEIKREDGEWLREGERGTALGIRVLLAVCRVFGRAGARMLLVPIALYYTLLGGLAARASRAYLARVHGTSRPGFAARYRHILRFAQCALDRVFLLRGEYSRFEIGCNGKEHLEQLERSRRGAILLGAHLGSFEAMRAMSRVQRLRINILVHYENARRINAFLAAVAPDFMGGVIEIDADDPSFIFAVRDRLEAGEMVAILGDRTGLAERSVEVEFLGSPASFPTGAFTLAAALKCPVYLTFGLHYPPRRYDLYCEPFADEIELPRGSREEVLLGYVERYARRLEHYCRLAPDNWFNFYDFWASECPPPTTPPS